jgi:type I restriction enzyme S subunit
LIYDQVWKENELVFLKDILKEPLRNGVSGSQSSDLQGLPTLTLTAVTQGNFEDNIKLTTTTSKRAEGLWLKKGDIFIQRSNAPRLVGTACAYRGVDDLAIFPDLLIRVRVDSDKADWRWIEAVLKSERTRKYFRTRSKGLSGSMPKISQPDILNLKVPLPSLEEQSRLISKIERETSLVSAAHNQVLKMGVEANSLRRSILNAAFTGKLAKEDVDV